MDWIGGAVHQVTCRQPIVPQPDPGSDLANSHPDLNWATLRRDKENNEIKKTFIKKICLEALKRPGKFGSEQFTEGDQTWSSVSISTIKR